MKKGRLYLHNLQTLLKLWDRRGLNTVIRECYVVRVVKIREPEE